MVDVLLIQRAGSTGSVVRMSASIFLFIVMDPRHLQCGCLSGHVTREQSDALALVRAGATFVDGELIERPDQREEDNDDDNDQELGA